MATVNLWPDDIATDIDLDGPVVVLKEQAALLGQKTKNLVEARVESDEADNETSHFIDRFVIYSTVINYRYELFSVEYPFEFYPATIHWEGYPTEVYLDVAAYDSVPLSPTRVNSREELENELKTIFADPKTVRIIQALISRARQ